MTFNEDFLSELAGLPTAEMDRRITNKLEECKAALNYDREMPTIAYDLRGRVAGYALLQKNHIQLNIDLLYSETDEMIEVTLPHEFAHIVAYYRHGDKGHGFYWKHVMRQLNLSPERCHNMEVIPARQTVKFDYVCSCPDRIHKIGKNRHHKIQSGQKTFYCTYCYTNLKEA